GNQWQRNPPMKPFQQVLIQMDRLTPEQRWQALLTLAMTCLAGLLIWSISSRRYWNVLDFTTMNPSQNFTAPSAEPIDLTKVDLHGALPPRDHPIYKVNGPARPCEISPFTNEVGPTPERMLAHLGFMDMRLQLVETKLFGKKAQNDRSN